jgi:hypothetical protein
MGRIILTMCGAVLALGLMASAQKADTSEIQQHTKAAQTEKQGALVPTQSSGLGQGSGATDRVAREANSIARSDLTAQQAMVLLAFGQMLLTGLGLYLIWETLKATRNAVEEASSATRAAQDAVEVTRTAAERQLRPYLLIDRTVGDGMALGATPKITVIAKNTGVTPAFNIRHVVRIDLVPSALDFDYPDVPADGLGSTATAGHETAYEFSIFTRRPLNREDCDMLVGGGSIVVWGRITYTDIDGNPYWSDFRASSTIRPDGTITLTGNPEGNDAT